MDHLEEELPQYLPGIEELLTSLFLEEANIEIASSKNIDHSEVTSELDESSIFLYARASNHDMDIIVILGEEWYGLLSSIMMGIEVKERNDDTVNLLQEFADSLCDTVRQQMKDDGEEVAQPETIQVLTLSDLEDTLKHSNYFQTNMAIEGIADNSVPAGCLFGNPDAPLEADESADDEQDTDETATDENEEDEKDIEPELENFSLLDEQKTEEKKEEAIIFGRHTKIPNGGYEDYNIDLLKNVELDLYVELGRTKLPLGDVLALAKGSVLELEELSGEPVDIMVNDHQIANGEVVVIDEHFGVRISNFKTTKKDLAELQQSS